MKGGALRYRKPRDVAVVESVGSAGAPGPVFVSKLPTGEILVLGGTASTIWRTVLTAASDDLVPRVAEGLGVEESAVASDILRFVDDLVARGLLETTPAP